MNNKIDYAVSILLILIISNSLFLLYAGSTQSLTSSCSLINPSGCFSNLNGSYSILGLNLTPIVNVFYAIYDAIMLIVSFFAVSISIPSLPLILSGFIDAVNGVLIAIFILSVLPYISGN